ncbi:MAG: succinate dehydrogenase assembly factor 2 [Proteobacteria bacterium]|jgi:antitoxin CptB|uniref:FAD assembly factor SdhE n=1 Tax=SAR86 cluster bacterium TaxID=2030880 RepID=A0A937I965_9GAMM|nr:succinate dehydrogenase assembly factor 2 [SAR86 cluster bacterium]MDA0775016.1 succinate dehydrogenase assembly factor 2 [Pseudomonadota bacterium]MDA0976550.1 succinate dehydrogenase assembly factor 2 [Pseudomonadota bacterium]MDA1037151.1 succinate dehydrogenase assembly factor 2 [Pseudomonadota bacterium]
MNKEINRLHWKCRRGMREIDLLLREFSMETLVNLEDDQIKLFDAVLDYDDQKLFDYIFKNISLNNKVHEVFIDKYLKNFSKQGNF